LASVGIYGVIAFAVSLRVDEIATPMAVGASPGHIFWLIVHQGGTLAAAASRRQEHADGKARFGVV